MSRSNSPVSHCAVRVMLSLSQVFVMHMFTWNKLIRNQGEHIDGQEMAFDRLCLTLYSSFGKVNPLNQFWFTDKWNIGYNGTNAVCQITAVDWRPVLRVHVKTRAALCLSVGPRTAGLGLEPDQTRVRDKQETEIPKVVSMAPCCVRRCSPGCTFIYLTF